MILQNLSQRQQLKILPQQIQLLNLFHLTTLELEQHIQIELENNPVLGEKQNENDENDAEISKDYTDWDAYVYDDTPDYKQEYANYFSSEKVPERPIENEINFRQTVKEQLRWQIKDPEKYLLAAYVADSLNDAGLLEISLEELAESISFKEKKWIETGDLKNILQIIKQLDPPGIGASNLQECFLLQLERLDKQDWLVKSAARLLKNYYGELTNRELEKIKTELSISEEELRKILEFIAGLEFRPVNKTESSDTIKELIIPDFIIMLEEGEFRVSLSRQRSDTLFINHSWVENIQHQMGQKDRAGKQYLKSKLQSAEWFVSAIREREYNMLGIMKAIVNWQKDYFLSGDMMQLRPMILKNIAGIAKVDISTVSRITSNKYAAAPFGNVLLKSLFSEGVKDLKGEMVNCRVIQKALKDTIDGEDKKRPFTDYELVGKLARDGFKLARRTVAKYREIMQIPSAQLRAMWK